MSNLFTGSQFSKPNYNVFDLGNERKFSGKMGNIIPIMVMDCVPGDQISIKSNAFVRFAPLIAPVMHRVNVYCHYFFVPNRLLWDNWQNFITGGEDGLDASVAPYIEHDLTQSAPGNLFDYLGLPVGADATPNPPAQFMAQISALPFAAYNLIYNEYYRDQNLIAETTAKLNDGLNAQTGGLTSLKKRAWQHDYFTSALPWTQKGPEALLPLGAEAPITAYTDEATPPYYQLVRDSATGVIQNTAAPGLALHQEDGSITPGGLPGDIVKNSQSVPKYIDLNGTHYADLSAATAASIIDLRRAVKLQEWLEKNARGGSRYNEFIKVHFGVTPSDARLQRPEYMGGFSAPIKISEVLQTSASGSDVQQFSTPQGNMAGHGVGMGSGGYASHFCEEHGYIIGLMSVMPQTAYQQGIPRHFKRFDKFDYFFTEFQHIGEEPVMMSELYAGVGTNDKVFGYKPRYAEYKYIPDSVHGDFRTTLDHWHMGRKFANEPALNEDFINMDYTEVDRIFAVEDDSDHLWCQVYNEVKAKRPMAYFGNPKW